MTEAAVINTTSEITFTNRWDHVLARMAFRRSDHRVLPGLYRIGLADRNSPVFVTANYTLSFDALREALAGMDAYILVLDTKGVNVWCAAGKGTFGTDELVSRIKCTDLKSVVDGRTLILPQLGATGVSAHKVREASGFEVEYGPILAKDIPEYLKMGETTPAMRRISFNLLDRLVLVPVEIVTTFVPFLAGAVTSYLAGDWFYLLWMLAAWLAGTFLFMALLPFLPTREFTTKGLILGAITAVPFVTYQFISGSNSIIVDVLRAFPMALITTAVTAYMALNMTGSTPITSWTSVKREISRYIPLLAGMAGFGTLLLILRLLGVGG